MKTEIDKIFEDLGFIKAQGKDGITFYDCQGVPIGYYGYISFTNGNVKKGINETYYDKDILEKAIEEKRKELSKHQ